jgi:hypothetical protein
MIDDDFTSNEKEDYKRKSTDEKDLDALVDDFDPEDDDLDDPWSDDSEGDEDAFGLDINE